MCIPVHPDTVSLTPCSSRVKQEIRRLETESRRWQVLVDGVTGVSPPEFDNGTLAILRGRTVRYLMRSAEVGVMSGV